MPVGDTLNDHFNIPTIPSVTDPINYWHVLTDENNRLALMVLDFLSAPGYVVHTFE